MSYKSPFTSKLLAIVFFTSASFGLAAVSIVSPINTPPAQASKFTKVKEIAKYVCEIGGCFYIVEQVAEYFQSPSNNTSDASNCSSSAKGCTVRTGGSAVKIGETRTIIRKVRVR
jgi:hypothetical protein